MKGRRRFRLDYTSVAGVPVGIGLVLVGQALEGGTVGSILQVTAALIVFGGTLGAVLLSFSLVDVWRAATSLRRVFLWDGEPLSHTIEAVVAYGVEARKGGLLSIEHALDAEADPFLRKAMQHAVDAMSPHTLREMLEVESQSREDFETVPANVYDAAGGYAPTVGILGAVLGLIQVMQNLGDPSKLGSGIAIAFVATLYGVGSANLVLLPIATKLKMKARHEARRRHLILEGVLAIQEGINPRMLQEKLRGYSAPSSTVDDRAPSKKRAE